jgi:hypothetical protein
MIHTCSVQSCTAQKIKAFGLCNKHYMRLKRGKDPHAPSCYDMTIAERLQAGLKPQDPVTGCIEWVGLNGDCTGYGNIKIPGGYMLTHRLAYELKHGPIPEGLDVCHHCDNPACCNTEHHFLGTDADNAADKAAKGRCNPPKGETHYRAKLTEADVVEIRRRLVAGETPGKIAPSFGVSLPTVKDIKARRSWAHLK